MWCLRMQGFQWNVFHIVWVNVHVLIHMVLSAVNCILLLRIMWVFVKRTSNESLTVSSVIRHYLLARKTASFLTIRIVIFTDLSCFIMFHIKLLCTCAADCDCQWYKFNDDINISTILHLVQWRTQSTVILLRVTTLDSHLMHYDCDRHACLISVCNCLSFSHLSHRMTDSLHRICIHCLLNEDYYSFTADWYLSQHIKLSNMHQHDPVNSSHAHSCVFLRGKKHVNSMRMSMIYVVNENEQHLSEFCSHSTAYKTHI